MEKVRRFFSELNPLVRGLGIIALIAGVVVVLSLESVLATVGGLLRIAFFLFLLRRERRSDIEAWSERSRRVFYGAIVLAVVDLGVYFGLGASGLDALAFFLVLGACGYAIYRVWRNEHTYG